MSCPHRWDLSPEEARSLQKELAKSVSIQPLPSTFEVLGAADIGYVPAANQLVAAVLTFSWPDLTVLEKAHFIGPIDFPYIPGLLSFREIPALMAAFEQLKRLPDVILCDGQGIAHPRKLGIASHLGLCLDIPTVGSAKKRLCGRHEPLELKRGNYTPLVYRRETIGYVYCSRDRVKPLYISPGHKADLESTRELIERTLGRFRLPEPQRQAHNYATILRQTIIAPE